MNYIIITWSYQRIVIEDNPHLLGLKLRYICNLLIVDLSRMFCPPEPALRSEEKDKWTIQTTVKLEFFQTQKTFKICAFSLPKEDSTKIQANTAKMIWRLCEIHCWMLISFNSLGPSDAIWRQRSGSTLGQVMACCQTAPSHYLNQCWVIISKVEWHSSKGKFTWDASAINHWNYLENQVPKISFKFPRGRWVNNILAHQNAAQWCQTGSCSKTCLPALLIWLDRTGKIARALQHEHVFPVWWKWINRTGRHVLL